jgi:hypothetical protein
MPKTICTKRHLVFHNEQTGETCSVPRSMHVNEAKIVPDWVLETDFFQLASKHGEAFEVVVPTVGLENAKVSKPPAELGIQDALRGISIAEAKEAPVVSEDSGDTASGRKKKTQ